ncbi:MAG: hypothetical protein ACXAD7_16140 [Candidatus Kariarchaeaceae archaeon]|jgi:hypothetical protein
MSHQNAMPLTPDRYVLILIGILGIIPGLITLRYYRDTRLTEYLVLSFLFLGLPINNIFNVWRHHVAPSKVLVILNQVPFITLYFLVYINSYYLDNSTINPRKKILLGIWYLLLTIPYLLGKIALLPDSGNVYLFSATINPALKGTEGLIFQIGSTIIMAEGYPLMESLSFLVLILMSLTNYLRADIPQEGRQAKMFWLIAIIFWLVRPILQVSNVLFSTSFPNVLGILFILVSVTSIAILSLKNPKYIIITKSQIIRAHDMYSMVDKTEKDIPSIKVDNYLKTLPESLRKKLGIS